MKLFQVIRRCAYLRNDKTAKRSYQAQRCSKTLGLGFMQLEDRIVLSAFGLPLDLSETVVVSISAEVSLLDETFSVATTTELASATSLSNPVATTSAAVSASVSATISSSPVVDVMSPGEDPNPPVVFHPAPVVTHPLPSVTPPSPILTFPDLVPPIADDAGLAPPADDGPEVPTVDDENSLGSDPATPNEDPGANDPLPSEGGSGLPTPISSNSNPPPPDSGSAGGSPSNQSLNDSVAPGKQTVPTNSFSSFTALDAAIAEIFGNAAQGQVRDGEFDSAKLDPARDLPQTSRLQTGMEDAVQVDQSLLELVSNSELGDDTSPTAPADAESAPTTKSVASLTLVSLLHDFFSGTPQSVSQFIAGFSPDDLAFAQQKLDELLDALRELGEGSGTLSHAAFGMCVLMTIASAASSCELTRRQIRRDRRRARTADGEEVLPPDMLFALTNVS